MQAGKDCNALIVSFDIDASAPNGQGRLFIGGIMSKYAPCIIGQDLKSRRNVMRSRRNRFRENPTPVALFCALLALVLLVIIVVVSIR
jgi:hypothetical protein